MNSTFGLDGPLFKGLAKAGDFLILGFIMTVFCIPVVTIGGSFSAAFYAACKLIKDEESHVHKDFWKSFKTNVIQGFFIEVIMAAIGAVLLMDVRAAYNWGYVQGSAVGKVFVYVIAGVALIWAAEILYAFAMQSRYANHVFATLKNALIVCTHHLPQTVILVVATYGLAYFTCQYFTAVIITVPVILYIDAYVFVRIFKQLEDPTKNKALETDENTVAKENTENGETVAKEDESPSEVDSEAEESVVKKDEASID